MEWRAGSHDFATPPLDPRFSPSRLRLSDGCWVAFGANVPRTSLFVGPGGYPRVKRPMHLFEEALPIALKRSLAAKHAVKVRLGTDHETTRQTCSHTYSRCASRSTTGPHDKISAA